LIFFLQRCHTGSHHAAALQHHTLPTLPPGQHVTASVELARQAQPKPLYFFGDFGSHLLLPLVSRRETMQRHPFTLMWDCKIPGPDSCAFTHWHPDPNKKPSLRSRFGQSFGDSSLWRSLSALGNPLLIMSLEPASYFMPSNVTCYYGHPRLEHLIRSKPRTLCGKCTAFYTL
jgi:hypothetical protein